MPKIGSLGIAEYITRLLDNRYDLRDIGEVVRVCHSLALAILRVKAARGRLHPEFLEYELSSLAYDFIGELFQRDETHRFVQLANSFERFEGSASDDEEVLVFLKKIVANKVEAGIFSTYREIDPVFSKILRNVRLVLSRCPEFQTLDWLGETYVYSCRKNDIQMEKPECPYEVMERELLASACAHGSIEALLAQFLGILNSQWEYRRIYPLMGVVGIMKSCFTTLSSTDALLTVPWIQNQQEFTRDIHLVVTHAIEDVQAKMRSTYVAKGKLSEAEYTSYFDAIKELLDDLYVYQNGECGSYFNYLAKHVASLDVEDYRAMHRSRFEYLVKVCREQARLQLKALL